MLASQQQRNLHTNDIRDSVPNSSVSLSEQEQGSRSLLSRLSGLQTFHGPLEITLLLPNNYKSFDLLHGLFRKRGGSSLGSFASGSSGVSQESQTDAFDTTFGPYNFITTWTKDQQLASLKKRRVDAHHGGSSMNVTRSTIEGKGKAVANVSEALVTQTPTIMLTGDDHQTDIQLLTPPPKESGISASQFVKTPHIYPCNIHMYRVPSPLSQTHLGSVVWIGWDIRIDGIDGFRSFFEECMSTVEKARGLQSSDSQKGDDLHILLSFTNIECIEDAISHYLPENTLIDRREVEQHYINYFYKSARELLLKEKQKRGFASTALIGVDSETTNYEFFRECFDYYDNGVSKFEKARDSSPQEEYFIPPHFDTNNHILQIDIRHVLTNSVKSSPSFEEVFKKKDSATTSPYTLFDMSKFLGELSSKNGEENTRAHDKAKLLDKSASDLQLKRQGQGKRTFSSSVLNSNVNFKRMTGLHKSASRPILQSSNSLRTLDSTADSTENAAQFFQSLLHTKQPSTKS